ncbi:hypothetical protein HRbin29_00456 [bacterium HR29]|jgi:hypothetical protein|nr:hypothetical protein HRbin29_00456 [bacterium HR29]
MPEPRHRRTRRRLPRAVTPRPTVRDVHAARSTERTVHTPPRMREHHITTDFSYVRSDLVTIAVLTAVIIGFIVGMRFAIG